MSINTKEKCNEHRLKNEYKLSAVIYVWMKWEEKL